MFFDNNGKNNKLSLNKTYKNAILKLKNNEMPDLKGLSMRSVIQIVSKHPAELKIEGSGYVVSQTPKPGAKSGEKWTLKFKNNS